MAKIINGINVNGFKRGWNGANGQFPIPLNIEKYLKCGQTEILLDNEHRNVSFTREDGMFLFSCGNSELRRPMKLYREWRNESLDMIMWLESVAVGECTRKVIQGEKLLD